MDKFRKVLIIGGMRLTSINACAHRMTSIAKLFKYNADKVYLLGIREDKDEGNAFGFDYFTYEYPRSFLSWIKFTFSSKQYIEVIKNIKELDCVVINGSCPSIPTEKIAKYCKKHNIKFIFDIGEWYEKPKSLAIKNFVKKVDVSIKMKKTCRRHENYIVASTFLEKFIGNKNVFLLPTIVDEKLDVHVSNEKTSNTIKLIFIGILEGKIKENLDDIINAINHFNHSHADIKFSLDIVGGAGEGNEFIKYHGQKPYEYCISQLLKSDFSVIPRDKNRKNESGFPTKLSESFLYGIPVIATDTSDLSLYIENDKNGYLVENNSTDEYISLFNNIYMKYKDSQNFLSTLKSSVIENNKLKIELFVDIFEKFISKLN